MKISRVLVNSKKKEFVIEAGARRLSLPFSAVPTPPSKEDPLIDLKVDPEMGSEGFTYFLRSGACESIHIDAVLEHNRDPDYLCELVLHDMTVHALKTLKTSRMSKRAIARRLNTSPKQLYRLLDPAFYGKSINQMVKLLHVLGIKVEVKLSKAA